MLNFKFNEPLSHHTTISSGGIAKKFICCEDDETIIESIKYSQAHSEIIQIISGGSNIIFHDRMFDGIVMKISTKGITEIIRNGNVFLTVKAGESWDGLVNYAVASGLQGIECMSGIPGSVGATPVQNVGAYGQEVKDVITSVTAIDWDSLKTITFSNEECNFSYRCSRFKSNDAGRFIITEVTFKLNKNKTPEIKYPELEKIILNDKDFEASDSVKDKLMIVRNTVINLRKSKSMIIDEKDPNSRSCGSFFTNPVLNENEFNKLKSRVSDFPFFKTDKGYKVPAAWLIENSGFRKGFKLKGAGISEKHSLAVINCGGNTSDILNLANKIEESVFIKFGIRLIKEPVIID
ncbi:MAG: UDP-N-acetylenolpyruvoylglucosamine reductase [Ignavibacteria bacterium]|nr:UDP-N-acetylenolpyruvoylglucosamine reductase [Ignavibacteria bacterium]